MLQVNRTVFEYYSQARHPPSHLVQKQLMTELIGSLNQIGLPKGPYSRLIVVNDKGGNDYWESGVVRADWVLQDFGKMLHPELFENATFTYFKQLK